MERMMDQIGNGVKGRIAEAKLSLMENEIRKYILKEFARNGRPPASGHIKVDLGLSSLDMVDQAIEKLQMFDILLRKKGEIISAYPFSVIKTRHKVIFKDGHCQ